MFNRRDAERREREWLRRETEWRAERRELLDRIMYLAEKPWAPPPDREVIYEPAEVDLEDPVTWAEALTLDEVQ